MVTPGFICSAMIPIQSRPLFSLPWRNLGSTFSRKRRMGASTARLALRVPANK